MFTQNISFKNFLIKNKNTTCKKKIKFNFKRKKSSN
jgi:hypothetical protein